MPHTKAIDQRRHTNPVRRTQARKPETRYTVGLVPTVARQVERFAQTTDTSMSKAIATLVRIGLEGQEQRKRDFFKKLRANLSSDDSSRQDQLVDEFRELILGR